MALNNNKTYNIVIKSFVLCFILLASVVFCLSSCESQAGDKQNTQGTTAAGGFIGDPSVSAGEHEPFDTSMLLSRVERTTWNIELSVKEITERSVVVIVRDMDNKGYFSIPEYYNLEYLTESGWVMITNHKDPTGIWDYGFTIPQKNKDYAETHAFIDFTLLYDRNILIPGKYRGVLYFNDHKGSDGIHEFRVEFELTAEQIAKIKETKK